MPAGESFENKTQNVTSRRTGDDIAHLVLRIGNGDASAEDELVRRFHGYVLALLRRRVRDREAQRELADDVLMGVVCALRAGRLRDATRLPAFVRGTLRNVANNHVRTRLPLDAEEPLTADLPGIEQPDRVEEGERLVAVRRGLDDLGGGDREILLMTMVDGLRPAQIAGLLGLKPEVVRARKSRALHRLIMSVQKGDRGRS